MRNAILVLAVIATALALVVGAAGSAGRFQLVAASVSVPTPSGDLGGPKLFRIDTTTGQTWEYVAGERHDGKPYSGWLVVAEKL